VALEVSDSGCGIAPRDLDRIFDPFFTTKEFGKGTGLGLATVLGIVKSHHGFVIVETVVNQGTTFRVLLPASREEICAQPRNGSDAMPRGHGESILVVDDEKNITAVNTKMLERYGYRVIIADNGNQALERFKLEGRRVDLVVTDIMMPGMDGLTLIQELRRLDPQVKIVACSGLDKTLGDPSQSGTLASLGVRSFLAKPFSAQRLLLVLRDLLASKENGQSQKEGQPAQSSADAKG
jgi:CheY-like chemotaxis protein